MIIDKRKMNSQIEDVLEDYLTGEIKRIVNRFEIKIERLKKSKLPDVYYCTLYGIDLENEKTGRTNSRADPVGNLAIKLADLAFEREDTYLYYKDLLNMLDNLFNNQLNKLDMQILLVDLGITNGGLTTIAKDNNISYPIVKKREIYVKELAYDKIKKFLIERRSDYYEEESSKEISV
ncbi:hypothetical protein [Natronospora cellulosivora (SeqCode)]